MKIAFFDSHTFEREVFEKVNQTHGHELKYFDSRLTKETAGLASGFTGVCAFANDKLTADTLKILMDNGTQVILLRSAGFNHVDLMAAKLLGLRVLRVPQYSPNAVAEHAVCLLLALNRKVHRAYWRVREMNFSLEGLVGFDVSSKTIGVIGTGKIGKIFSQILLGFGSRVLTFDKHPDAELASHPNLKYVTLDKLLENADVISLHVPLVPETKHLIDGTSFSKMKPGVFLINTGRGALIDTKALIQSLKNGKVGAAGLDVYEEEENVFFKDLSEKIVQDDQLARLLTFPNVLITSHQGFLTKEALFNIATTTLQNATDFERGNRLLNEVTIELVK